MVVANVTPKYDEPDYDESEGIGCYQCEGGWKHGCCDDLCRNSSDAADCEFGRPCPYCNPEGEVPW